MSDLDKLEELFRCGFVLEKEYSQRKTDLRGEGITNGSDTKKKNREPAELACADYIHRIPQMLKDIRGNDPNTCLEAVISVRRLLSLEVNPPIDEILQAGFLPRLVVFLREGAYSSLQFNSAWALTNIASGKSHQTQAVIDSGAVPELVEILRSPSMDVREQAAWALGNVAGDSPIMRDYVIATGILDSLLFALNDEPSVALLRNATWTLSNLCRGRPQPPFHIMAKALPTLCKLIHNTDEEVRIDVMWALSYLSDGPNAQIQAVLEHGIIRTVVNSVMCESSSIVVPALRTAGNIATGNDLQTQLLINVGVIPNLLSLLSSPKRGIRKETCWTFSNIAAGNRAQVQMLIDCDLFPKVLELAKTDEYEIRKETAWILGNSLSGSSSDQINYFVEIGVPGVLCSFIKDGPTTDPKIAKITLEGLENILKSGMRQGREDEFREMIEEAGGGDYIESLQSHQSKDVLVKAFDILINFFNASSDLANMAI